MTDYDFVVVGSGIAGASVAALLAEQGKVVLLEGERQPGYHATGRSAAYFAPAYGNEVVRSMTQLSDGFYRQPPDSFTVPLLRTRAALFIATAAQLPDLETMATEQPGLELLQASALLEQVPLLKSEAVTAGLLDRSGGDLDVDAILQGFLRLYRSRRGETRFQAPVTEISRIGAGWKIRAGDQVLKAPVIVNAAGAWADEVAGLAGLTPLGFEPLKRTVVLVDAPVGGSFQSWPLVIDVDEQFYFKPDAGQLLISPANETPSPPCDAYADDIEVAVAVDRVQQVLDLAVERVNHSWAGLRTFAPDRSLVAGFDPRIDGFFWLAGQGGYGVQTAPAMAEAACQLLTGQPGGIVGFDPALETALSPSRLL